MAYVTKKTNEEAAKHLQELINMKNPLVKVGWFSGSEYPDGTPVAAVAAIHVFGSPKKKIPKRDFMRPTIKQEKQNWARIVASKLKSGNLTAGEVCEILGLKVAGDIRKAIKNLTSPPLKLSTIAARLRRRHAKKGTKKAQSTTIDKPLVDTAVMITSLTSKVEDKRK